MAQRAALPAWYSRAQLLVPIVSPPIVVAVIELAYAICSSVSPRSVPGAALANVLARIILACLIATGGRSPNLIRWSIRAKPSARPGGLPSGRAWAKAVRGIAARAFSKSSRRERRRVYAVGRLT